MKVKRVDYNWTDDYQHAIPFHEVGHKDVVSITGKAPRVHGDQWNYMVVFKDGSAERVFNINRVFYYGKEEGKTRTS